MTAELIPNKTYILIDRDNAMEHYFKLCKRYFNLCSMYNTIVVGTTKDKVWEKMGQLISRIVRMQNYMDGWEMPYPTMTTMCSNHYRQKYAKYTVTDEELDAFWHTDADLWADAMINALPADF